MLDQIILKIGLQFGKAGQKSAAEDIVDQYIHRNIPGYSYWDWNWMINQYGADAVRWNLGDCSNKLGAVQKGVFKFDNASTMNIRAEAPTAIPVNTSNMQASSRTLRSIQERSLEPVASALVAAEPNASTSNTVINNFVDNKLPQVIIDDLDISGGGIISGVEDSLTRNIKDIKSKNISIRKRLVTKKDREKSLNQKGIVIWLTGMPGCGKNEIAVKLEKKLFDLGRKVYYIDSSHVRFGLSSDLSFTGKDAHEQTRRIAEVANMFADSGTITIVTSVSRFKDDREYARNTIGKENYIEIFVDAPEDICKKRNSNAFKEDGDGLLSYETSDYPVTALYIKDAEFNSDKKVQDILDIIK
nr:adenylyl-sulfate kinase [Clostridium sp. Marseille-Q2269]